MRPQTFAPGRYFAAAAALLLLRGTLTAQVTANSKLTPEPPVRTTQDSSCHANTAPGTSIPDKLSMDYTCYDPAAPPESEISPGVAVPFTYSATSWGDLIAGMNGVCMSEYPAIANSSFAAYPTGTTYLQPNSLELQLGAEPVVDYCSGTVTFTAGTTVTWPGGSITLQASITSPKCWPAYNQLAWTEPPASCPDNPATATCPNTMVAEGNACVCPSGTYYQSSSDSCVLPCSGNPGFVCGGPGGEGYGNPVCTNGQWGCPGGATQCSIPPPDGGCGAGMTLTCGGVGEQIGGNLAAVCIGGCGSCPILIDTQDQGFHLTDWQHGVSFPFFPDKPPMQLSWTDAAYANGWLALDRNGKGVIDNATELFGNITPQPPSDAPNGFLALSVFDEPANGGNGNGVIDPGDAVYPHLRVWIDANHDGISQPDELKTLQEVGIFRIDRSEERRVGKEGRS